MFAWIVASRKRALLILLMLFLSACAIYWSGLGANDSGRYVQTALFWGEDAPYLARSHWGLRHLIVLPVAASFALFGPGEFTAAIPNLLYAAALVGISYWFARRHFGDMAGFVLAAFVAVSAAFVDAQLELSVHGVTAFFTILAFWLFLEALRAPNARTLAALSGVVGAGAWLCTETAIFIPGAFLAFVLLSRRQLNAGLIAATGFAGVILLEMAFYALVAGNPFYRYEIDLGHDNGRGVATVLTEPSKGGVFLGRTIHHLFSDPTTTPFLILAALAWLHQGFRRYALSDPRRLALALFAIGAAISFLSSTVLFNLKSPHYYSLLHYFALLSLAAFVGWLAASGRARFAAAGAASLLMLNFAIVDFRTYGDKYEARQLAGHIVKAGATVVTDPKTAARSRTLLRLYGYDPEEASERVRSINQYPHGLCGEVFVATPIGAAPAITPMPDWRMITEYEPRSTPWTHALLRIIRLDRRGPAKLRGMISEKPPAALYAASSCPAPEIRG